MTAMSLAMHVSVAHAGCRVGAWSCRLVPPGGRGSAVSCILSRDMQDRQLSWIALAQAKIRSQTPFLSGQSFRTTWAPPLMVDLGALTSSLAVQSDLQCTLLLLPKAQYSVPTVAVVELFWA